MDEKKCKTDGWGELVLINIDKASDFNTLKKEFKNDNKELKNKENYCENKNKILDAFKKGYIYGLFVKQTIQMIKDDVLGKGVFCNPFLNSTTKYLLPCFCIKGDDDDAASMIWTHTRARNMGFAKKLIELLKIKHVYLPAPECLTFWEKCGFLNKEEYLKKFENFKKDIYIHKCFDIKIFCLNDVKTKDFIKFWGIEKDAYVLSKPDDIMKSPRFDFYKDQKYLIIDDFSGWIKQDILLEILNGKSFLLMDRNYPVMAKWEYVYIIINIDFDEWIKGNYAKKWGYDCGLVDIINNTKVCSFKIGELPYEIFIEK